MHLDGLCIGCLSTGRRLEPIAGAERLYFNEVLEDAGAGAWREAAPALCWECAGGVRRALRLRARQAAAASLLRQKYGANYMIKDGSYCFTSNHMQLESLSGLSCCTNTCILEMTYEDSAGLVVKEEADYDDEGSAEDAGHAAPDNDCDYNDTKYMIKCDILGYEPSIIEQNTTGKNKVTEAEGFDESDDEPLTLKKLKQENKKPRGRRKKQDGGAKESGVKEASGARGANGARGASGAREARMAARLRALRVPARLLEVVVLSWEEVEAERQRALASERYTRHEHRCPRCALGFNQRAKLRRHMEKHDPSAGALECPACHVRCRAPHSLAAHQRRHRVRWRCVVCGALWSRAAVAADHLARAHNLAAPTHACPTCPHTATSLGKLRTHLKEHAARARCHVCGKSLRDRASLNTHLQTHSGEKEHVCEAAGCGKRFLFKKALQLHAVTHAAHQHLYCHTCDMTFKNQTTFYHHMKYSRRHVHPDALKHACAECGRRFVSARRLAEHHAALHARTKPERCEHAGCDFACASRGVLRAHVAGAHRGRRPRRDHVCHACGKQYTTKKSLEGHLRSHSGERPFRCGQCGAAFGYHAALYNHARLVHRRHKAKRERASEVTQATAAPPPAPRT